jgi:predicted nucleic acid-binding protein
MSEGVPRLVIDSSVAVKWFLAEGEADVGKALELLSEHRSGAVLLCAPAHLLLEVLNALRFRGSSPVEIATAAQALLRARLELTPVEELASRAAELACKHDLTVYDAAFAALAERLGAFLVTADRRVARSGACLVRSL